ncbi:MAG: hypothetical protein AAF074_22880 [Pseudomonadota bacterium]
MDQRPDNGGPGDGGPENGTLMLAIMLGMGAIVLGLLYVPGVQPEQAVLDCDRRGGVWSASERSCEISDSPLAGLPA